MKNLMRAALALLTMINTPTVEALGSHRHLQFKNVFGSGEEHEQRIKREILESGAELPTELYFNTSIDHFNGSYADTYQMRYLIDTQYYDERKGAVLFYAGNEGDVWTFYNNSGFMTTTLAQNLSAAVVFAEHRYYGKSMPFGNESFSGKEHLRFLSVEQVMQDYQKLIGSLSTQGITTEGRAVIAFGGSYGGMLAAWMRMKYPHKIQGAVASSAPILWF